MCIRDSHQTCCAQHEDADVFPKCLFALVDGHGLRRAVPALCLCSVDVFNDVCDEQQQHDHGLHDRQLTVETERPQQDDTPNHQRALERKLLPLDDCR